MELSEIYKEWYYKELEHSERLSSKISGHLTLISILGAGVVFIWSNFKGNCDDTLFLILNIIATVLFMVTCVLFAIAYKGKKYGFINIKKMSDQFNEIDKISNEFPKLNSDCKNKMEQLLSESYINIALENRNYNLKKSNIQHRILISLIIAYLFLFISTAYCYIKLI